MEHRQLIINIAGTEIEVFMQGGFWDFNFTSPAFHKHRYAEIHVVSQGEIDFILNGDTVCLKAGEILVIPDNTFHRYEKKKEVNHFAFQINYPIAKLRKLKVSQDIISKTINEISAYKKSGESTKLSAYISFLCSEVCSYIKSEITPIQNRSFIIYEFFANNYNRNITLSDIATKLNLSEKQAERLIKKHTGNSFRQELIAHRMEAAKRLMETEKFTLSEIAEQVGYESYSGFWKAYNKYFEEKEK